MLDLWLGELLVCFEGKHVVVDFFAGPVQDDLMLEEFVLRMLSREAAVLWELGRRGNTSRPYGFRKKSRCFSELARIFLAILGMKVVMNIYI